MPSRITLAAVGTDGLPQISEVLLEIERHEVPQYVRGSHVLKELRMLLLGTGGENPLWSRPGEAVSNARPMD